MKITMIGTLPPITSISAYCLEQVTALGQLVDIQFINFKILYPKFLFKWMREELNDSAPFSSIKNVHQLRILSWYNPFSWIYAGLILDGDIVHFHWWTFYLFPVFFTILCIAKLRHKKIVCTLHNVRGHETNSIDWLLTKIILVFPQSVIVHSDENKQSLVRRYHVSWDRIVVISYGVFTFYKTERLSKIQARRFLKISLDRKIVLFFGCIRKYKGLDVLIRAFSIVRQSVPKAVLLIVGECWEDWEAYNSLIYQLHMESDVILNICFIPTKEVQYYFAAADLLVCPYKHFESQSGPGVIGLAFHKAMVVTRVGGLPMLVKNKNCIVKPDSHKDLTRRIVKILNDNEFRKILERDSRDLARKYSWDNIAHKTVVLYKEILRINF